MSINIVLHITNGDSTVRGLEASGLPGAALPWRNALHEGPVPAGLSRQDLCTVRADFIVDQGWGHAREVRRSFKERDAMLESWHEHEEVVLWFEHDLYDQLQLIQILDFFAEEKLGEGRLHLLSIDRHPEIERFLGLGQLAPPPSGAGGLAMGS